MFQIVWTPIPGRKLRMFATSLKLKSLWRIPGWILGGGNYKPVIPLSLLLETFMDWNTNGELQASTWPSSILLTFISITSLQFNANFNRDGAIFTFFPLFIPGLRGVNPTFILSYERCKWMMCSLYERSMNFLNMFISRMIAVNTVKLIFMCRKCFL